MLRHRDKEIAGTGSTCRIKVSYHRSFGFLQEFAEHEAERQNHENRVCYLNGRLLQQQLKEQRRISEEDDIWLEQEEINLVTMLYHGMHGIVGDFKTVILETKSDG